MPAVHGLADIARRHEPFIFCDSDPAMAHFKVQYEFVEQMSKTYTGNSRVPQIVALLFRPHNNPLRLGFRTLVHWI